MNKRDRQLFDRVTQRARELFEATPRENNNRNLIYTATVMIRAGVMILDYEKLGELDGENGGQVGGGGVRWQACRPCSAPYCLMAEWVISIEKSATSTGSSPPWRRGAAGCGLSFRNLQKYEEGCWR
jgi:hypothetical protein